LTQDVLESKVEEFSGISDEALRQQAIDAGNNRPGARGERNVYYRAAAVTAHVLRRAKGVCECCKTPAPFKTKRDKPYLECHHVDRRADSGPDDIYSVIALHPLCHSRIHHAADGDEQNEKARRILAEKEPRPTQYDS